LIDNKLQRNSSGLIAGIRESRFVEQNVVSKLYRGHLSFVNAPDAADPIFFAMPRRAAMEQGGDATLDLCDRVGIMMKWNFVLNIETKALRNRWRSHGQGTAGCARPACSFLACSFLA